MSDSLLHWSRKGFNLVGDTLKRTVTSPSFMQKKELDENIDYVDKILNGRKIVKVLDIVPCPAPRMTKSDKWKLDPFHLDPRKRQRKEVTKYFEFKNKLMTLLNNDEKSYLTDEIFLIFVLPMPKTWSEKKKKLMNKKPHKQKPDFDNLTKAFCDSFGIDDSHVWNAQITKFWGYSGSIIIYK